MSLWKQLSAVEKMATVERMAGEGKWANQIAAELGAGHANSVRSVARRAGVILPPQPDNARATKRQGRAQVNSMWDLDPHELRHTIAVRASKGARATRRALNG